MTSRWGRIVSTAPSLELDDTSAPRIFEIRGGNVVLDRDVARLFGVETKVFNQQVKRNKSKFGTDFAFRLTEEEFADLRLQTVTSSGWGGTRYRPMVFTEHGVVMAATILHTKRAAQASRFIVKIFVQARRNAAEQRNLPVTVHPRVTISLAAEMRQNLMGKINDALGHVLNAIVDQRTNRTVREEALDIANEGLRSLKD
ncbi:MAG TPA: ORF6N domain-containing protein, partial [Vicinamibacterales bacterium]